MSFSFCGSFFAYNSFILASDVDHIIISEIQIGGESVYDEFIELYNPTDSEINLDGWDLKRKTKSGTESNILNNIEGVVLAYGYFLIVPRANCGESKTENCYKGAAAFDNEYTTNSFLAKDNTVLLYNSDGALIDKVGWGEAEDFEGEAISIDPKNGESLERKTARDTDNNNIDFALQDNPGPQNSNNNIDNSGQESSIQESDSGQGTESDNNEEQNNSIQESGANDETHPNPSQEGNKIIITEFLPNPEDSDRDNEFIEIYNDGDAEIDLDGWILEDKIGNVKKFIIPDGTEIIAGKYKVFYSDETRITLNNSGDGVFLKDDRNNIIDETPVSDAVKEEQSYALNENRVWVLTLSPTPGRENIIKVEEDDDEEQNGATAFQDYGASGGEINEEKELSSEASELSSFSGNYDTEQDGSIQKYEADTGYDYSDAIVVSEIYPNPFGRDNREGNYEWIELYNNSSEDVNLKGWQIDDILEKGSKAYIIEEDKIIKARSFAVFENVQTKIMLNNIGDEVNILWPDGEVVDSVRYEKADEGLSYNWTPNSWTWSSEISSGKNNRTEAIITEKEADKNNPEQGFVMGVEDEEDESGEIEDMEIDYIEADIEDIKHFTKHSRVKVSGIVSTPPGIFADDVFYLSGSGIQVFSYEVKFSKIELGDEVELIGRVSEVGGEKRILLDNEEDIKINSRDNLVEAQLISTGNINESMEGYLVLIEGKVSQIKNDVFFLDDGSGEVKVYIKPRTEIEKPEIKIGDWMAVTGQASQTSAGYRILPRFQGDIRLSRVSGASIVKASSDLEEAKNKVENNKNSLWNILFFIIAALILVDWGRIKMAKSRKSIKS